MSAIHNEQVENWLIKRPADKGQSAGDKASPPPRKGPHSRALEVEGAGGSKEVAIEVLKVGSILG